MAAKKFGSNSRKKPSDEKPQLTSTKPKIVRMKIDAGVEPRRVDESFYDTPEYQALSKDEKRFVSEYILDRNATRAYMRAGMEASTYGSAATAGWLLLKRFEVSNAVKKAAEMLSEAVKEDFTSIIANFQQIRDRCLQAIPVVDKKGNPTGYWKFDAANAIAANKEIGMALGILSHKHKIEHSGSVGVKVEGVIKLELADLQELSFAAREELLALMRKRQQPAMIVNGKPSGN